MQEFDSVIKHTAEIEDLLVDALSRKHKYSLDPTEDQDFIPHSIDPTEDSPEPQNTSITTNKLSISPVPEEIRMVSRACVNFKETDCEYNMCAGRNESLGHYPSFPYLDEANQGDYEDYDDNKEEEMQSDEDILSTISQEIFDGYEFDPHQYIVEHDQLNGYHHISVPSDDASSVTNDDNIPTIITDSVNDAWEYYKQHRKQHNTDCHDYNCRSHGSLYQNGNRNFPTTRCSVCRTYRHGYLDCTLAEAVYQKKQEFQSSQRYSWKLKATTIPPNHAPSSETPDIDITKLNIKEAPNPTPMWSAEKWVIRNATIARHEP